MLSALYMFLLSSAAQRFRRLSYLRYKQQNQCCEMFGGWRHLSSESPYRLNTGLASIDLLLLTLHQEFHFVAKNHINERVQISGCI